MKRAGQPKTNSSSDASPEPSSVLVNEAVLRKSPQLWLPVLLTTCTCEVPGASVAEYVSVSFGGVPLNDQPETGAAIDQSTPVPDGSGSVTATPAASTVGLTLVSVTVKPI